MRIYVLLLCASLLYSQPLITRIANDRFEVTVNESTEIRMLQVTDLHLGKVGFWKHDLATLRRIKRLVEMTNPHILAVTGDLFTGEKPFGSLLALTVVPFFDGLERPWLYVFGNHDPEGGFGREQIYEVFAESQWNILGFHSHNSSDKKYDYVVDIKPENSTESWLVYAFDSGSRNGFKSIKSDQLEWYNQISASINPALHLRAISIFHIPLKQYQDLWDDPTCTKYGQSREKVCYEEDDGSVYEAFVKRGEIEATFCGHDHYNHFWGTYHGGIILAYGYISGEATKWAWPTGGKLISLPLHSGSIKIENVVPDFASAR